MFTPAITASRTSSPRVMRPKASSTAVRGPPFLCLFPLAEAMTTGLTVFGAITVGPWANPRPAPAAPPRLDDRTPAESLCHLVVSFPRRYYLYGSQARAHRRAASAGRAIAV